MLVFEIGSDEIHYLDGIAADFKENIVMTKSKNFSGGSEIFDIIIVLTPTILSSVALIMNNLLQHRLAKMEIYRNQPTEISFKVKDNNDDYEILVKSSTISNKNELEDAISNAINRIKEIKGYEKL